VRRYMLNTCGDRPRVYHNLHGTRWRVATPHWQGSHHHPTSPTATSPTTSPEASLDLPERESRFRAVRRPSTAQRIFSDKRKTLYSLHPENNGTKLIACVDADEVSHLVIRALLSPLGAFRIMKLYSGEELLAALEELPLQPDIILVEANLPGMDGFEVS